MYHRLPVQGAVAIHDRHHAAFLDGGFKGQAVFIQQGALGAIRLAAVSSAQRVAVSQEVLGGGHDFLPALQTLDESGGHPGRQQRRFAVGFPHPAPAGVAPQSSSGEWAP